MVANHGNSGGPVLDSNGKVIGLLEGDEPDQNGSRTGLERVVPAYYLSILVYRLHG
jgi:S1-C subfamily serine protease